jgi:hypothetical protein
MINLERHKGVCVECYSPSELERCCNPECENMLCGNQNHRVSGKDGLFFCATPCRERTEKLPPKKLQKIVSGRRIVRR